jgi:hypothetical protein
VIALRRRTDYQFSPSHASQLSAGSENLGTLGCRLRHGGVGNMTRPARWYLDTTWTWGHRGNLIRSIAEKINVLARTVPAPDIDCDAYSLAVVGPDISTPELGEPSPFQR